MALGDRFKGLFRKRTLKELSNPSSRASIIAQVCQEAAEARARNLEDPDAWRAPVHELVEALGEVGADECEALRAAAAAMPDAPHWTQEIVRRLLAMTHVPEQDLSYLQAEAVRQLHNLSLWRRLLEERRYYRNRMLENQSLETMVLSLGQLFPSPGVSNWMDVDTESEARSLFYDTLDGVIDALIETGRDDAGAEELLRLALAHRPDSESLLTLLARSIAHQNRRDAESVGIALRALLKSPDDIHLMAFAGEALSMMAGHEGEGLEMLREVYRRDPDNEVALRRLASALGRQDTMSDADAGILSRWLRRHREDEAVAEVLAAHYARNRDLGPEALAAYKIAAHTSANRAAYMRMLGRAHASQGNWTEVIELFDEIHKQGDGTQDIVIPLATAYAEVGRADDSALDLYRSAIVHGSRHTEIHNHLCRALYHRSPDDPDAVRQFRSSLEVAPESLWARLGVLRHRVLSGDGERALDDAIALLSKSPRDMEIQKLAGFALADSFKRQNIRKVIALGGATALAVLRHAFDRQPDALPLLNAYVRQRLVAGLRDEETARLLAELCRRDSDAIDMRIARADLLWELDDRANSVQLYRELLARWKAQGSMSFANSSQSGISVMPQERSRILGRVAEQLVRPPGPKPEDLEVLLEAAMDPAASPEFILSVAHALIDAKHPHPLRLPFLERAHAVAPDDERLELAVAEARAAKGNPRKALQLAIKRVATRHFDDNTIKLLDAALQFAQREHLNEETRRSLHEVATSTRPIPEAALILAAEAVALAQMWDKAYVGFLQRAVDAHPRKAKLLGALARCQEAAGMLQEAMESYRGVVDLLPNDDEAVLRLVRAHVSLQRHGPETLEVARRAFEISPEDHDIAFHYAAALLESGAPRKAAPVLESLLGQDAALDARIAALVEQAAPLSSDQGEILLLLSKVYTRLQKTEQALVTLSRLHSRWSQHRTALKECYDELIRIDRSNPRPWVERGILWKLVGDLEQAEHDLCEAARLAPGNLNILEEYVEVIEQRIRSGGSQDAEPWVQLAEKWLEIERTWDAQEALARALEINPDHPQGLLLRARLDMADGDLAGAREYLLRAPTLPGKVKLWQQLARRYEEIEEFALAADVLAEAQSETPEHVEIIEQMRAVNQHLAHLRAEDPEWRQILGELSVGARTRYDMRERIGQGAVGEVFLAYDKELDELVVLKLLGHEYDGDAEVQQRFRLEAKAARRLSHPNIVRIHDLGEEGGRKHISMEYVPGGDLRTFFRAHDRRLPNDFVVDIVRQVARALVHAHSEGILHRDIKPGNILMATRGRVKLSDFGIAAITAGRYEEEKTAKERDPFASSTGGAVAGSPLYMAPEQFVETEPLSEASDVYSLGVMFFELLAGEPPFTRGSIAYHHQFTPPPALPPSVPALLREVVAKCLQKQPADRYQNAVDLLNALDGWDGNRHQRKAAGDINSLVTPEEWSFEDLPAGG